MELQFYFGELSTSVCHFVVRNHDCAGLCGGPALELQFYFGELSTSVCHFVVRNHDCAGFLSSVDTASSHPTGVKGWVREFGLQIERMRKCQATNKGVGLSSAFT